MRTQHMGGIVVADAKPLERLGVAAVLKSAFHYERLDFATEAFELEELLKLLPDLALVDLELPGLCPRDIKQIRTDYPQTAIVLMSSDCSPQTVLTILGCGVHGFVPKSLNQTEMVAALRQVAAGYVYVPHSVCDSHLASAASPDDLSKFAMHELTHRQQQVLELVSSGKSNKEIARKLLISEATVKVHLSAAFRSMGVNNRISAVALFRDWPAAQNAQSLAD